MKPSDKSAQPFESLDSGRPPSAAVQDGGAINPYSPAHEIADDRDANGGGVPRDGDAFASLPRTIVRWSVVCSISAAPSFFLGLEVTQGRSLGMIAAIITFIGFYVVADLTSRHWPLRRNRSVRRTLVFVYVSRLLASVIIPVGMFLDTATGIVMMMLVNRTSDSFRNAGTGLGAELANFWLAYGMTFVQAILMNGVLVVWGLIALPVITMYTRRGTAASASASPLDQRDGAIVSA